ncbi:hypothetical protein [Nostoc sp.]|uniref:hypothetical protein n=1 Tax=Nostoc sp. TaxID=1180 RepID=UPI002FFACDF2
MSLDRKQIITQVPSRIPDLIKTTADDGDYALMVDSSGTPYKITKAKLLAGLSSGGGDTLAGGGTGGVSVSLTFANDADTNGLFYYLGTNKGSAAWSNPSGNLLTVIASSIGYGSPTTLVNRQGDKFWTDNETNCWVSFLLQTGALKCNHYSIKSRSNDNGYYPRTWKLQGSNDGSTWTDLDVQIENTTLVSAGQWLSLSVAASSVYYSRFRLLKNGKDSAGYDFLCLDEVELYGSFTP